MTQDFTYVLTENRKEQICYGFGQTKWQRNSYWQQFLIHEITNEFL